MRKFVFIACAVFLASAQAPGDGVMSHYRAYRAAIEAGDLAAAEREARSALDASVARDQDGGRTGVLALNLARVMLANEHRAEAYAPALQAFTISSNNASSGVDPLLARLVLGRAELTPAHEVEGRARLIASLEEARSREDLGAETYAAAVDLGHRTLAARQFAEAASAWSVAAQLARFSPSDSGLALGEARTAEGVAWISLAVAAELQSQRRGIGLTGSILPGADERESYGRAQTALLEAERALLPLALVRGETDDLTIVQRDYALALAWRGIIGARLYSNNQRGLVSSDSGQEVAVQGDSRPVCRMHIDANPEPIYPNAALVGVTNSFGVVVLRIHLDSAGQPTDVRVAAAVPQEHFQEAVERVASRWPIRRAADSPADCRIQPVIYMTVTFRIM